MVTSFTIISMVIAKKNPKTPKSVIYSEEKAATVICLVLDPHATCGPELGRAAQAAVVSALRGLG